MIEIRREKKKPVVLIRPASSLELYNYEKRKLDGSKKPVQNSQLEATKS